MSKGRVAFYGILLAGAAGVGLHFWLQSIPVRVERAVNGLRHPNAKVASAAWHELYTLYRTKWAAVYPVLAHARDEAPISFLVERETFAAPGKPDRESFWAKGKPIYYKTDRIHCHSVGDAIRAILYGETDTRGKPRWRTDFYGDWDAWWEANQGYYGV